MSLYIVDIHGELEGDYEEICKYEPCEDAVSREDAIVALDYQIEISSDDGFEKYKPEIKQILNTIYDVQKKQIQALPSVTPKDDVLEKIRAEIEERRDKATDAEYWGLMDALRIIDKYKAESEEV